MLTTDADALRLDVETNLLGVLHVAQAFAPILARTPGSALVNILSVASLANMKAIGGYSASKAAAWSLSQALKAELAPRGIAVHSVFPGPIDTDMIRTFDLPKTPAAQVANAILDGVEAGTDDIFPDPMSREVGALFARDPAEVARRFAGA